MSDVIQHIRCRGCESVIHSNQASKIAAWKAWHVRHCSSATPARWAWY